MGEIVKGLDRDRIASLRSAGRFFWADVSVATVSGADLLDVLDVPEHALRRLLDFRESTPPSRKSHADGEHLVFPFSCFVGPRRRPIEVNLLVNGDFLLTVHRSKASLPDELEVESPEGRSEQYFVYAILEAMVATAFDALNRVELELEKLQTTSVEMQAARVRIKTVRSLTSRLTRTRRHVAPYRGIFERVSEEIGRVEGLEPDTERYFERVGEQLNRLVDGIDAASDGIAKLLDLRMNETMYWLTAVATVFLPLTFVTGFFGMNFGWMVKEIDSAVAFWLLGVGGSILAAVLTAYLVRRRGSPVETDER